MRIFIHGEPSPSFERAVFGLDRLGMKIERLSRAAFSGLPALDTAAGPSMKLLMADEDGLPRLLRISRENGMACPVLVIQGDVCENSVPDLLDAGADDVVPDGCPASEIAARFRSIMRRVSGSGRNVVDLGSLAVPLDGGPPLIDGRAVDLSAREQDVLRIIAMNHPRRVSKQAIYDALFAFTAHTPRLKVIDSHIHNLRRKIAMTDPAGRDMIDTSVGLGYRIRTG